MAPRTRALVAELGRRFTHLLKDKVRAVQDYVLLSARGLTALVSGRRYVPEMVVQMDSLGVQSLSIVVLTGMFTGMVLALQSAASLDVFGARPYVGRLVCVSMVRELGPVLTALMVTGRVGSGMAAELGSMVVTQQIDALRVLGSDPVRKLVAPRLLAGVVMVPILTVISDALGIFGGGLLSVLSLNLNWTYYWRSVAEALVLNDLVMGLSKPVVFGFILTSVGCHMGLTTTGGTQGVGVATTRSVVVASVLILATDLFMTKLLLVLFPVV
ncbi:MAG TPA: ABC transporter permease [Vicinamibacteria bacterium]|nr:ABC transporter permease [Vicinamibacteria bacterium]